MPFARISMKGLPPEDGETLTLHVFLNDDYTPNRNHPCTGWRGRPGDDWCWPVVFLPDGTVDHGGLPAESKEERFSNMQIFERALKKGNKYTMVHANGDAPSEFILQVIQVEDNDGNLKRF